MTGVRLNFVVEGQTEEAFVNEVLKPHLAKMSIWAHVRCLQTSRKRNIRHRGGLARYAQARQDLHRWMREQRGSDVRFTTMFDLFRLPGDFPGYDLATQATPSARASALQAAMFEDLGDSRLIPYIQVHEFEALILSSPAELSVLYPESSEGINRLVQMADRFASPEDIDGGPDSAPSKRIIKEIPTYSKTAAGSIVTARIGLPSMRSKCPHFDAWVQRIETDSCSGSNL